jgi:hypothetical protein
MECKSYDKGSFPVTVKWHSRQFDAFKGYADLTEALGRNFAAIAELGHIVMSLPNETGARVVSVVASIANHIRSGIDDRPETKETVLDSFRGRVEKIEEGIAYVKFVDQNGAISHAQIAAADLAKKGISEGDAFICEIKATDGETTMTISPVPKKKLSAAEYAEIDRELDEALPDSFFDSNKK